ncbi:alpha/beta hydrolase [Streptomyces sennicomposti]
MALTGTTFFIVLVVATFLAMVGTVALWPKVGGPRGLRWLTHGVMIAVCQVTAISVVATWINNSYGLYASWADLLGTTSSANADAMPGPPASRAQFNHSTREGVLDTYFRGGRSALSGQVLVWTPPQYDEPAYRKKRFPVLILMHGVPGSPQSWVEHGGMPGDFEQLVKQRKVHPFILAMPVIDPGSVDTDCSDLPDRKVATWLAYDVPDLLKRKFRTLSGHSGWGVMGYSTGGYCAAKLPLQYPKIFGAGAAIDPDPLTGDTSVLPDPELRAANTPTKLVAGSKARVSLFLATSRQDRVSPPASIEKFLAASATSSVQVRTQLLPSGGHNYQTFAASYPMAFHWLGAWLSAPK